MLVGFDVLFEVMDFVATNIAADVDVDVDVDVDGVTVENIFEGGRSADSLHFLHSGTSKHSLLKKESDKTTMESDNTFIHTSKYSFRLDSLIQTIVRCCMNTGTVFACCINSSASPTIS